MVSARGASVARPIKGISLTHGQSPEQHSAGVKPTDLQLTDAQSAQQAHFVRGHAAAFLSEVNSIGSTQYSPSSASSYGLQSETSPAPRSSYTSNDTRDRWPQSISASNSRYKAAFGITLSHTNSQRHAARNEQRGVPVPSSGVGGRAGQAQQYWDDATAGWHTHTGQPIGLLSAAFHHEDMMQDDTGWPMPSQTDGFLDDTTPTAPTEDATQRALDAILDGMMTLNGGRLPHAPLDAQLLLGLQNQLGIPSEVLQEMFQERLTERYAESSFSGPSSLVSSLPEHNGPGTAPDQQDLDDVLRFDLEEQRKPCTTRHPVHNMAFSCRGCGAGRNNFTQWRRHRAGRFHLVFYRCLICNKIVGRHIHEHMHEVAGHKRCTICNINVLGDYDVHFRIVHVQEPPIRFRSIHYNPSDRVGYCFYCSPVKVFEGPRAAKWKELQKHMFNEHREQFQNPRRATQNQGSGFNRHDESGGANGGAAGGGPRNSNAGGHYGHGGGGSALGDTAGSGQQQGAQSPASGYSLNWSPGTAPSIDDLLDRGRSIHRQGSFIRSPRTSIGMPEADDLTKQLNRCETGCGLPIALDYQSDDDDLSEMDVFGFDLEDEETTIDRVSTLPSTSASIDDIKLIAHYNGRQKNSGPSGNGNLLPALRKDPTTDLPIRGKCPVTTIARQHLSEEHMSLLERHSDFRVHVGGRVIMNHRPLGGCPELPSVPVASSYAWPALLLGEGEMLDEIA